MKRKVLFLISQLHKGGAETSLVHLINSLNPEQYDIELMVMNQVPVKGAISLIGSVADHVRVVDVFHEENKNRVIRKVYHRLQRGRAFSEVAIRYVTGKQYDLAIHVGEWWSPNFLASFVQAKKKMVWFHADIDKSNVFSPDSFFSLDSHIDKYLFVSVHSMEASCKRYPFITGKSSVLHNAIDLDEIRQKSKESCDIYRNNKLPLLVTLANIRTEKGQFRAVEAMKELQKRGRDFVWWNIGHASAEDEVNKLRSEIDNYGLENRFLLLGAYANPYPLLMQADALACLSDFESWSLVITEARCLGIPVIATKTSGATEQIQDGENGFLTDFDPIEIADAIEKVLFNSSIQKRLRHYLEHNDRLPNAMEEFKALFDEKFEKQERGSVLFVIDDVNYPGGAHAACFRQISFLQSQGIKVDIYSPTWPNVKVLSLLPETRFISYYGTKEQLMIGRSPLCCLVAKDLSFEEKKQRIEAFLTFRRTKSTAFTEVYQDNYVKNLASNYDVVCVLSEGSRFKKVIAESHAKKKVQWIHTDYTAWRKLSDWTLQLTKDDGEIWKSMDQIVVLSDVFHQSLGNLYPHLREQIATVGNLQPDQVIKKRAKEPILLFHNVVYFIHRDKQELEANQILSSLMDLKKKGLTFYWIIVGVPYRVMKKYPQLEDSVRCFPATEGILYDNLFKDKDVLFCNEYTDPAIVHAAEDNQMIICTMDRVCSSPVQQSNGWIIPRNMDVVSFLFHRSIQIMLQRKEQKMMSEIKAATQAIHPIRFISCFRFEPVKNVAGIIRVLGRLRTCGIPFEWVFVGDGEQFGMAKEMVQQYKLDPFVIFAGWQSNVFPFLAQSDVFVQFSHYEGLPNSIYEALILGKPVLSTNVGAIQDQITPGENGWLIEPTEHALFEALLHIALNEGEVRQYQRNLSTYVYRNDIVEKQLLAVLDPDQVIAVNSNENMNHVGTNF